VWQRDFREAFDELAVAVEGLLVVAELDMTTGQLV
jgi:hypothetical protein